MNKTYSVQHFLPVLGGLIFFLLPWYYTDSGLPQPVDVPMIILVASLCLLGIPNSLTYFYHSKILRSFIFLSVYASIIFLIEFIISNQFISLLLLLQNFYFVLLLIGFLSFFSYLKNRYDFAFFYKLTLIFLIVDLLIPLFFLTKTITPILLFSQFQLSTSRISLSFNNQNQLGFFALVNLSLFFYMTLQARAHAIKIKKTLSMIIINLNLLLLFLSASRACYPIILLYVFSYPMIFNFRVRGFTQVLAGCLGAFAILVSLMEIAYKLYAHMLFVRKSTTPTDAFGLFNDFYFRAIRGFSDVFSDSWYFLFGNGNYKSASRGSLEFHNNFLAMWNMIGLIGLLLYIYMNLLIFKNLMKKGFYYLMPYLCYLFFSMFHYSYRTRPHWILLAMFIFIIVESQKQPKNYIR
mgnify:CR=1 FL=1